jgi:hypothetical protein
MENPGEAIMKLKMNLVAGVVVLSAVLGYAHEHGENCSHEHAREQKREHEHEHHEHDEHGKCASEGRTESHNKPESALNVVSIAKAVQDVMGLKTVHAEKRRVASTLVFAGRYELSPDARKVVATPVAGRLTLLVRPLAEVKKGDALFKVSSPDLVARTHDIEALEKRVNVYREIKTPNAALENELAVKRAERKAMLAGVEEKDGVITVRAADDGMVESLIAQDGAWLETGAAALQTVRTHDLRFKALVAASDALRLRNGMPAKVDGHHGHIRIGVGDDTGIVPIYVLFDKDVHALAGARSQAECVTGETERPHIAVPSRCIVSVGLQPTVFIRDEHDAGRFIAVPVTPGVSGGGWTAVEGLPSGHCEVVCEGAYELKLALPSAGGSKSAGHFHADGTFHEGEDGH